MGITPSFQVGKPGSSPGVRSLALLAQWILRLSTEQENGEFESPRGYMDNRLPVRFLNYPGDVRGILNEGRKGPTMFNEWVYPVTASYDPKTNKTRVGFSYIAPAQDE